jgi:hypothetical protein
MTLGIFSELLRWLRQGETRRTLEKGRTTLVSGPAGGVTGAAGLCHNRKSDSCQMLASLASARPELDTTGFSRLRLRWRSE